METIRMCCAVIRWNDRIFVSQRGYGDLDEGWEFPGVIYEEGEYGPSRLVEAIVEEFETMVEVQDKLCTVKYDYQDQHVIMDAYWCKVKKGYLEGVDSDIMHWLRPLELDYVTWLPADRQIVDQIQASFAA